MNLGAYASALLDMRAFGVGFVKTYIGLDGNVRAERLDPYAIPPLP